MQSKHKHDGEQGAVATPRVPDRRSVGRPARVTREQILDEAERISFEKLTLPLLAERLGIRTASLYHHFESRDALLIALGARCYERFELPRPDPANWRGWLLEEAKRMHEMFVSNPVLLRVNDLRHLRSVLPMLETGLETLVGAGFADDEALFVWNSVYFNVVSQARSTLDEGSHAARALAEMLLNPDGQFPRARTVATSLMLRYRDREKVKDAWLRWLVSSIPEPRRKR
jgi:AcrR family transcriptional regulator